MSATELTTAAVRETTENGENREIHALTGDLLANPDVADAAIRVEGDEAVFLDAGERELRPYGSSTRFTFTRTSLDLSGFDDTEPVTVYAREGAILLVSNRAERVEGVEELLDVRLDVANVPEDLARTVESYGARIVPESVEVTADGTLAFSLSLPSGFERVTDRDVRPFGDSTAFTVPPDALRIAGLGEGDSVDVRATEGAVLMAR